MHNTTKTPKLMTVVINDLKVVFITITVQSSKTSNTNYYYDVKTE